MARNIRLYPALFVMVVTTTVMMAYWSHWKLSHKDMVRSVLALCYMTNLSELGGIFHNTWSLGVEEHFYVAWSLALPWVSELSTRPRALLLGGLTLVSALVNMRVFPGPYWLVGDTSLSANLFKLLIGACLRLLPLPRFLYSKFTAHVGFACLALLILSPFVDATRALVAPVAPILAVSSAALIIMASVVGDEAGSVPFLQSKAFRFTGRISYGWYLWQLPMQKLTSWSERRRQRPVFLAVSATSVGFLAAVASTFLLEEPIRAWFKDRQRRKR